jgi:hypothetical protein
MSDLWPYVTSRSEGAELSEGVGPNIFDVALHCGPGLIAISCQQCVNDGKVFLADLDGAFGHSADGKQLRAFSEVFDNAGEQGISRSLCDEGMQIAAHCAQIFRGRISIGFHGNQSCPQSFKISHRDLTGRSPGRIPFKQDANLPNVKKVFDGNCPYHKGAASLPLENLFAFKPPNRFPQRCAGNVELPGKTGFQDYVIGAKLSRTEHLNHSCIRNIGERPAIRSLGRRADATNPKRLLDAASCTSGLLWQYILGSPWVWPAFHGYSNYYSIVSCNSARYVVYILDS